MFVKIFVEKGTGYKILHEHPDPRVIFHCPKATLEKFTRMTKLSPMRRPFQPMVYIMTCESHSTLYIGVTSDPVKRLFQHQNGYFEGFTKKYHLHKLIFYECHETMDSAISREKQLKHWKRAWKEGLISEMNPEWKDLSSDVDW